MLRYCGYDSSERPIIPRGPASRFTEEQISEMIAMVADGANSNEIGHTLDLKPEAVRAKLWRLGIRLRRHVLKSRARMVVDITRRIHHAARARGISPQQLIRRLLQVISRENLFDQLLPIARAHSLGAAAVADRRYDRPPTILRRIELAGCIGTPQFVACLAPWHS